MKKIISLFCRNYDGNHLVRNEVVPGAEWVENGEGIATQKHDGTCCLVKNNELWKRYTLKNGKKTPSTFVPTTEVDPVTGKQEGWLLVGDSHEDKWHREAFVNQKDGTYELCGPKTQGNPEGLVEHILIPHGSHAIDNVPRTFDELKVWFIGRDIEGIVWHHSDGRMVKIKGKDFGIQRGKAK